MVKADFLRNLYYITHIDNIPSILERGILSHRRIVEEDIPYTRIDDKEIVDRRKTISTPNGHVLWDYANLYFRARNAMLFKVIHKVGKDNVAILVVSPDVKDLSGVFITTGNAAANASEMLQANEGIKTLYQMRKDLEVTYWKDYDGTKRKTMAECLVPDFVPPDKINMIYVADEPTSKKVKKNIGERVPVSCDPDLFFQPFRTYRISKNLILVDGDMFFTRAQTLTISVNTVGAMGKGLASHAKNLFPDVYVEFQRVCRSKELQMGQPFLYQRESTLDWDICDDPGDPGISKWFLLFPTKNHWKKPADYDGIEQGLQWIVANYQEMRIRSLAVPALGCGLGQLAWEDVGPLMGQYLSQLRISVAIYLPREKIPPADQLTPEFILSKS